MSGGGEKFVMTSLDEVRFRGPPGPPAPPQAPFAFDPDEPREPAGSAGGGRWASGGGSGDAAALRREARGRAATARRSLSAGLRAVDTGRLGDSARSAVIDAYGHARRPENRDGFRGDETAALAERAAAALDRHGWLEGASRAAAYLRRAAGHARAAAEGHRKADLAAAAAREGRRAERRAAARPQRQAMRKARAAAAELLPGPNTAAGDLGFGFDPGEGEALLAPTRSALSAFEVSWGAGDVQGSLAAAGAVRRAAAGLSAALAGVPGHAADRDTARALALNAGDLVTHLTAYAAASGSAHFSLDAPDLSGLGDLLNLSRQEVLDALFDAAIDSFDLALPDAGFGAPDQPRLPAGQAGGGEWTSGGGGAGAGDDRVARRAAGDARRARAAARQEAAETRYREKAAEVRAKVDPAHAAVVLDAVTQLLPKYFRRGRFGGADSDSVPEGALLDELDRRGLLDARRVYPAKVHQLLARMVFLGDLVRVEEGTGDVLSSRKNVSYALPRKADAPFYSPDQPALKGPSDFVQQIRPEGTAAFYSPDQPRVPAGSAGGGRWTKGAGAEEARAAASDVVRAFARGQGPPTAAEAEALAGHLAKLTVSQIHALKAEHGLKGSAPNKAALVAKLAERFRAHRAANPVAPPPPASAPAAAVPVPASAAPAPPAPAAPAAAPPPEVPAPAAGSPADAGAVLKAKLEGHLDAIRSGTVAGTDIMAAAMKDVEDAFAGTRKPADAVAVAKAFGIPAPGTSRDSAITAVREHVKGRLQFLLRTKLTGGAETAKRLGEKFAKGDRPGVRPPKSPEDPA